MSYYTTSMVSWRNSLYTGTIRVIREEKHFIAASSIHGESAKAEAQGDRKKLRSVLQISVEVSRFALIPLYGPSGIKGVEPIIGALVSMHTILV